MSKPDRWIGYAQVYIDACGHTRFVLIHEDNGMSGYRLIGPLGTTIEMTERVGGEMTLKRLAEKELRKGGY